MSRFSTGMAALLALLAVWPGKVFGQGPVSVLAPASSGGIEAIDRSLVRLSGHRRLLIVGAHPDDEDNALLAWVSHGLGGEVAYLSLSRGEGGQNLIGPELGGELGVVRTGELESARALEGGRQFFTRAYDFGYTRSLEETFERWPRDELLLDAVRVTRRFKPQVVVAVFPESERAGHGQHQASAVIAREIFELAGDSTAFPELEAEGLAAWSPQLLYRRAWWQEDSSVRFILDRLDPISGRSLGQLAAASRSLHRSQDMGRLQRIGAVSGGLVWIAGGTGGETGNVFDGVDTRLAAISTPIEDATIRGELEKILQRAEEESRAIRQRLTPVGRADSAQAIAGVVGLLDRALEVAARGGSRAVEELVAEKRETAARALLAASGVVADAVLDREVVVTGGRARAELELWSPSMDAMTVSGVGLAGNAGWVVGKVSELRDEEDASGIARWGADIEVLQDAAPSAPYFLTEDRIGDMYTWDQVPDLVRGEPFSPPPLLAHFDLVVAGVPVRLEREVVFRWEDQARGEVRRPVRAVPALEIELDSELELWRRGITEKAEVELLVRSNLDGPAAGRLIVETPAGWTFDGPDEFRIEAARGSTVLKLQLHPAEDIEVGRLHFRFAVENSEGVFSESFPVLEYEHLRPRVVPRSARLEMSVFDLELPNLERVGYVAGASDRLPAVLRALGVPIVLLTDDDLGIGDLDQYPVILIGSRAYETNHELRRSNARLLGYVERGGTLVVQYQQYQFVHGGYALRRLEIERPHGRVTDETAEVSVVEPRHQVLDRPNVIGDADWRGWVQERGLYFPSSWDEAFRPVLAMSDSGREKELGSLLVAEVGEGTYIYSGLSFFRQLPAGIPGAIRLFANMMAAGLAADSNQEQDE